MACIRKRRGKWVVDYRDAVGARRWVTCETRAQADAVLEGALRESRQPVRPSRRSEHHACSLLGAVARHHPRPPQGRDRGELRCGAAPAPVAHLRARQGAASATRASADFPRAHKLMSGLSRGTVRILHATLRAMLNAAVDDGVIAVNPANRLGRPLRLAPSPSARQETIKAMTREQLAAFLAAATGRDANDEDRRLYPLMLTMARTGMRLGRGAGRAMGRRRLCGRAIRVGARLVGRAHRNPEERPRAHRGHGGATGPRAAPASPRSSGRPRRSSAGGRGSLAVGFVHEGGDAAGQSSRAPSVVTRRLPGRAKLRCTSRPTPCATLSPRSCSNRARAPATCSARTRGTPRSS